LEHQEIDLSVSKMHGSLTPTSFLMLGIGGWKTCPPRAQKCSSSIRDSNISNKGSKNGTEMSLATFLKPKERYKENYKKLIKFSSRKDSQRKGKDKQTFCSKNGTTDANRKKSSRYRNLE